MLSEELLNKVNEYKILIDKQFGSEDGQKLLKILKEEYVDRSVLGKTPEETYYLLGKKELLEHIESVLKTEDYVDRLKIHANQYNEH